MTTSTPAAEAAAGSDTARGIVDCDVHCYFKDGLNDLAPFMSETWKQLLGIGNAEWSTHFNGGRVGLPRNDFYPLVSGSIRRDAVPEDGSVASSNPQQVIDKLLDPYGVERAILLGGPFSGLGSFPNNDAAAVLAAAYNDWLSETWLAYDERFRGAMLVAPNAPELAVKEIERVADRPGIAGIHMPAPSAAPGEKQFWPVYEAAQHYGLPILNHGGEEATYRLSPQLAYVPTYYVEWHATCTQSAQSSLASLLVHGVFEKFPRLNYVFVEMGFAWLADLLWRLTRNWKAQHREIPWVKRPPAEYVTTNIRFTTQPFYEPAKPEHLHAILEVIDAENTLLFASDYPHWDFDDPKRALAALPKELRPNVYGGTARRMFGDRLN